MSMKSLVSSGNRVFISVANRLQAPFLLAVRLYWGWQFWQAGWGKLHRIPQVTEFFTSLGIPMPHLNAICISSLEVAGGILLALGLGSRLIGLVLAGDMFVAYLTAERDALFSIFSDPGKFYTADSYTFLFAALMILILGPGLFSLDALLEKMWGSPKEGEVYQPRTV
jgi:putative oxidoreductase